MKDILQELEALQGESVQFLEHMVNLESPSYDPALVNGLVEFLADEFGKLGGETTRIPEEDCGDHMVIRFPGESDTPIMLLGHTDTVWPEGTLKRRPFNVTGDIATGPGVFDMKAGIVLMWMTIRGLIKLRGRSPHPLSILLISNEEVGSPGSRSLVRSQAEQVSTVLVLEPPLPGGALKTTRNGMGRFVVKARGKAAHTGINPQDGVNAVEEIAHQIMRIRKLGEARKNTTVTVATVEGGTRPNVVPEECFIQVDARTPTRSEADRITAAINALEPVLEGARLEIEGAFRRPPLEPTPGNMKLFDYAREVARDLGRDLEGGATGGTSDGNLTSAMGVPTLDGLGAVGLGAHQVEEQVEISSLPWRAALVAGLIERIGK